MPTFRKYAATMLFATAGISTHAVHAAQDAMSRAEARQTVEDRTPQAQFQTSKREANAAYQEALAECKKMRGTDRNKCMSEAKTNLQNDLAEARKALTSGQ
ncbi:hypothetical protein [Noviherbaspirillum saxi]|uniref:PsiF repeat-containing protein n=1 Tax=Noviherbaspirillum saxi TaxID=2320863 RepID=A0A3A3FUZ4_9BURK|nr:hypothetical protein [Noviherbaspirillum saxi]RJF99154.1 hypothetical protein D3871_11990 [Noviherbaspirillum saxi]